jgi:hypothetical protein
MTRLPRLLAWTLIILAAGVCLVRLTLDLKQLDAGAHQEHPETPVMPHAADEITPAPAPGNMAR